MVKRDQFFKNSFISASIKTLREGSGMTIAEFACRVGLSSKMIEEIESGSLEPSLLVISRICGALNIELSELIEKAADISVKENCRMA